MNEIADRGGFAPGRDHIADGTLFRTAPAEHHGSDAVREGGLDGFDILGCRAPLAPSIPIPAAKRGRGGRTKLDAQNTRAAPQTPAGDGGENGRICSDALSSQAVLEPRARRKVGAGGGPRGRVTQRSNASPNERASDGAGAGHTLRGTHKGPARATECTGLLRNGLHTSLAGAGGDLDEGDTQHPRVPAHLIAEIVSLHREHQGLQRGRITWDLRIAAETRWKAAQRIIASGGSVGTKFPPVTDEDREWVKATRGSYFAMQAATETVRAECQKRLIRETRKLHVHAWMLSVKGFGEASLAAIVGEAGDIGSYANPGKLWKRMGLAVFDGKAQGKSATDYERQGYNPRRRSVMHVVGENLLRSGGPYAEVYRDYKARKIAAWAEAGIVVVPAAKRKEGQETDGHLHKMSLRYCEKRLLRDLWRAWRGQGDDDTRGRVSPAEIPV